MDKSKREKDGLYEIACLKQKDYYRAAECSEGSYFVKRNDDTYMREYGFETLPELKEELNKMWGGDETLETCLQTVLVAAFKLKPSDESDNGEDKESSGHERKDEKLLPYIYNF